ncbi:MAG: alpha/beta hydrolase [Pseudomonadales bacterium]
MSALRRWLLKPLIYLAALAATVLITIILVFAVQARLRLPELQAWHRIALSGEFRADGVVASFAEYRALEERLFNELRERLLNDPDASDTFALGRYNPASEVSRLAFDTPHNRSFELAPDGETRGAVLLVHGLTDSPYMLRHVAEVFRSQGYHVVVLRMPGHGTVPAALVDVRWEDWHAAVLLAARYTAGVAGPDRPFLVGGFSTGAALVSLYSVQALDDPGLRAPDGLYLLSAAIGISPFAVLTNVVSGLAFLPPFEKARWLDVLPEYEPYKYNSFPVNAANQIYGLTRALDEALQDAEGAGRLAEMAPVVMFQSIVDSTVVAADVIRGMLNRLPRGGHELVVFDVNRNALSQGLLAPGPLEDLERLRNATDNPFAITVIGNAAPDSRAVAAYRREAGTREVIVTDLPLAWPPSVFSLGHLALPMPVDDPVLGLVPAPDALPRYNLGGVALRGESGALILPMGTFARIRSNPFFDVVRDTITARLQQSPSR